MKTFRKYSTFALAVLVFVALSAGPAFAQILSSGYYYPDKIDHDFQGLSKFTNATGPAITGTVTAAGVTATGTVQGATLTATGAANVGTILTRKAEVLTNTDVALVSPAVTFSAASKGRITLTADGNLTGVYPTGGTVGQVIYIFSGAGANTLRFDDGTSMSLGGSNITLTEGVDDCLALMCTSADGDEWRVVAMPSTAVIGTTGSFSGAVSVGSLASTGSITAGGVVSSGAILGTAITGSGAAVLNSTVKTKGLITADGGLTTTNTLTAAGALNATGTTTLGANGSGLTCLRIVRVTVASGVTSGTAAGTGLTASSKVVGMGPANASSNACYATSAVCETGAVDVTVNTDPGVSTKIYDVLIAN